MKLLVSKTELEIQIEILEEKIKYLEYEDIPTDEEVMELEKLKSFVAGCRHILEYVDE